jgi:anthranilate phosphoribosyltransferase
MRRQVTVFVKWHCKGRYAGRHTIRRIEYWCILESYGKEKLLITEPFPTARFIKEIGRGKEGARSLSRADAELLYAAMLAGRVSDLELGGILLAMRIKGESVDEIAGFLDAAEASFAQLPVPARSYAPVVMPSYNGARNMPNLMPLLALLLAREGVPVLVHGVLHDPNRVTTAEIFEAMNYPAVQSVQQATDFLDRQEPVFIPIDILAPRMARLLGLRRILGVRNSTHTLVKLIQPFAGPALRLTSYTHPEYLAMLTAYFTTAALAIRGDAFLMRGTEGETVTNAKRAQQIDWFHQGKHVILEHKQASMDMVPILPSGRDAVTTARWIEAALRGEQPVPATILQQVAHCVDVSRKLRATIFVPSSASAGED